MSRVLSCTVLAGGVVYPAGTAEADISTEISRDDVWEGQPDADTEPAPKSRKRTQGKRSS